MKNNGEIMAFVLISSKVTNFHVKEVVVSENASLVMQGVWGLNGSIIKIYILYNT